LNFIQQLSNRSPSQPVALELILPARKPLTVFDIDRVVQNGYLDGRKREDPKSVTACHRMPGTFAAF
jgi:hypothetical protein